MATPETNSPEKIESNPEASQETVKALLDLIVDVIGNAQNATAMLRLGDESIIVTRSANDISTKKVLAKPESVPPLATIAINRTAYSDPPSTEAEVNYEIVNTPDGKYKVVEPTTPSGRPETAEDLLGPSSQNERVEVLEHIGQIRAKEKLAARGLDQRTVEAITLDIAFSEPAISPEEETQLSSKPTDYPE
jgi:hypothetical protein